MIIIKDKDNKRYLSESASKIPWSEFYNILHEYGDSLYLQIELLDGTSKSEMDIKGKFLMMLLQNNIQFSAAEASRTRTVYRLKGDSVRSIEQPNAGEPVFYIFQKNKSTCKISILY